MKNPGSYSCREYSGSKSRTQSGKPVILALLSVPYDLDKLQNIGTAIAAYNPRSVSLEALVEVLFGKTEAKGSLPIDVNFVK
jgi:hypothetical protein